MTEKQWIDTMAPLAQMAQKKFGYLASVLIAQTCLENGYGMDKSCDVLTQAHNVLGMKKELLNKTWTSEYWKGDTIEKVTPEWVNGKVIHKPDIFRAYESFQDCLFDYCQFMRDARYSVGGSYKYRDVLSIQDPETLIKTVSGRGYCTDPSYAVSVMKIVKKHDLTQYDAKAAVVMTVRSIMSSYGKVLVDLIAANRSEVPYHNANSHKFLVIHYLGVDGADNPYLYDHGYGGHFYVPINGIKAYQAAEVTDKIWHVGASSKNGYRYIHPEARNDNCIGIEIGTFKDARGRWQFREEAQETAAELAAAIMLVYNIPMNNLLRHGDVTTKCCPVPLMPASRGGCEGQGSNWTWEKFRARVAECMKNVGGKVVQDTSTGTTGERLLRKGDSGEDVRTMQERLWTAGFCGCSYYYDGGKEKFCDGVFGKWTAASVLMLQASAELDMDGIYGPKSREALDKLISGDKLTVTVDGLLAAAKAVAEENLQKNFIYGDAPAAPAVYPKCKLTSCDRYVGQVLYRCGLHDVGNRSVHDLSNWLLTQKGGKKVSPEDVQPGDIIFQAHHTYILGHQAGGGLWERYDSGSVYRIRLTGPYKEYKSQPFMEELGEVIFGVRLPLLEEKSDNSESEKSDDGQKPGVQYRVQVGAFAYRPYAERMQQKLFDAGIKSIIRDVGEGDRYVVQVGVYEVKENAERKRQELAQVGIDSLIMEI